MTTAIVALVETAQHLAAIQLEGVLDNVGFSNADKHVGAHLAHVVASDPSNEAAVLSLAALVGVKYARQTKEIVGEEMAAELRAMAKGGKLTAEQRDAARRTVIAQPDSHPKFGPRTLFSFPFNQDFAFALKQHGGRCFSGPDGFKWAVQPANVEAAVAALKQHGATVVGDLSVAEGVAPSIPEARVVRCKVVGRKAVLSFGYDRALVDAIKTIPSRGYEAATKTWNVSALHLAQTAQVLQRVGEDVDVSALTEAAEHVAPVARPTLAPEAPITVDPELLTGLRGYQRDGVSFLTQPLAPIRETLGASVRGLILADDMGLGKTPQLAVAASATATPGERIVVVCPASAKVMWERAIRKFVGPSETVCIVDGETLDLSARWVILNYDLLSRNYRALEAAGFAVLILDESQYAKNRTAARTRCLAGGTVVLKQQPVPGRDDRTKAPREVEGLASVASRRVYEASGTPMANRPSDLFTQLRIVGHPLGKSWAAFANRHCDPAQNEYGKTYNGASNIAELREAVNPIFLQRKKTDYLKDLPAKVREWEAVEVDLRAYRAVMADYEARRKSGQLSTKASHLAILSEARMCAAVAKVPATVERIRIALERGEKVLVFSCYARVLALLEAALEDLLPELSKELHETLDYVTLDGTKSQKARNKAMDSFQGAPNVRVFLGQLIAAGTAITLTAATQVLVNDLDWVPANHRQAEDRAHRMGQLRNVFANYMVAAGTFDEDMAVMLEEKIDAVNEFEGTNETLFDQLLARLATAPQNAEARQLTEDLGKRLSLPG